MKKKLFISCPMNSRTEENIKRSMERMHKLAEIIFDQELEVIPTWIDELPSEDVKTQGVWYLGKSIELLAKADYFIGVGYSECFKGCTVEADVARRYGIRSTYVDISDFMPDAAEIEKDYYEGLANGVAYPKAC